MSRLNKKSNVFLITGMAGVGKSSVRKELEVRGFQAVNLDTYNSDTLGKLSYWGGDDGEPAPDKHWDNREWLETYYWRWRREVLEEIIRGHDPQKPLFLEGRARNQEDLFGYFSRVVLLSMSAEILRERMKMREGDSSHAFGQHPVTQAFLLKSLFPFERKAREAGAIPIDTTNLAIKAVANKVIKLCIP